MTDGRTDGRTDGQTDGRTSKIVLRAALELAAKKCYQCIIEFDDECQTLKRPDFKIIIQIYLFTSVQILIFSIYYHFINNKLVTT